MKYAICEKPELFKDIQYKDISYNLVLLHAIFSWNKKHPGMDIKEKLQQLRAIVYFDNDSFFYEKNLLELFSFKIVSQDKQMIGFVLIDRSYGCFPLIFYPEEYNPNPEKRDRVKGIQSSIREINNNIARFLNIFSNHDEWNEDLVKELRKQFRYGSNDSELQEKETG